VLEVLAHLPLQLILRLVALGQVAVIPHLIRLLLVVRRVEMVEIQLL
jgi:hypothetical protein